MVSTNGAPDGSGQGNRPGVNQRVARLRGGLEKAVTGREHVIKRQARSIAEKIDLKTAGRHHNKLRFALRAVELAVDNVSARRGTPPQSASHPPQGAQQEPEDLGEFRNLSDRR